VAVSYGAAFSQENIEKRTGRSERRLFNTSPTRGGIYTIFLFREVGHHFSISLKKI
jgi:hypothetical protein